jgi:hypothetical protein
VDTARPVDVAAAAALHVVQSAGGYASGAIGTGGS